MIQGVIHVMVWGGEQTGGVQRLRGGATARGGTENGDMGTQALQVFIEHRQRRGGHREAPTAPAWPGIQGPGVEVAPHLQDGEGGGCIAAGGCIWLRGDPPPTLFPEGPINCLISGGRGIVTHLPTPPPSPQSS